VRYGWPGGRPFVTPQRLRPRCHLPERRLALASGDRPPAADVELGLKTERFELHAELLGSRA
jgi:hypothetical protein